MKTTIIVDTGVIVEYLKSGKGVLPAVYEKYDMVISPSTYSQILASKTFKDASLEKEVIDFLDKYFKVQEVDKKVALEASRVIREYEVTLSVAMIAACSTVNKFKLLTDDRKPFEKISGVELLSL